MSTPRPHDYSSEKCWCGEINPLVKYPPKEGVAAPLEPSAQEFAKAYVQQLNAKARKGTQYFIGENDIKLMEAYAAAVSKKELAQAREKNRELNRKCQALQHTINIGAERKAWYGYYQACASLYDGAMRSKERAETRILELEEEIAALRETK